MSIALNRDEGPMKKTTGIDIRDTMQSVFYWDVLVELDVVGPESLLNVEEMLHRNTKFLDIYSGDLDLGNFIKYMLVVCTTALKQGQDRKGGNRFYAGLESRVIVRFETPGLIYTSPMEFRYHIQYGALLDRTLTQFKIIIRDTKTKCKELQEVVSHYLGPQLDLANQHYLANYPVRLRFDTNPWIFKS